MANSPSRRPQTSPNNRRRGSPQPGRRNSIPSTTKRPLVPYSRSPVVLQKNFPSKKQGRNNKDHTLKLENICAEQPVDINGVGEFGIGRPKESNCLAPVKLKDGMLFSWANHTSQACPGKGQFFDGSPNLFAKRDQRRRFVSRTQLERPGTAPDHGLHPAPVMPPAPAITVDTDYKESYAGPLGEIPGLHKRADFASHQGQMAKELKRTVRLACEEIHSHGFSTNHPVHLPGKDRARTAPGVPRSFKSHEASQALPAQDRAGPASTWGWGEVQDESSTQVTTAQ